jgi:hypothetical protein
MSRPYTSRYGSPMDDHATEVIVGVEDDARYDATYDAEYLDEYDGYDSDDDPPDRRWYWVTGVAAVVLVAAVIGTMVVIGGGDSGTTSATITPPTAKATVTPSRTATAGPPPPTSLAPETISSVTPTAAPSAAPTETAPPAPAPRTVVYSVTGSRQLIDLVTVIYTDGKGALQTDVNVALPWTKSVVLDPGVELSSVTATSIAGQINCAITDASGAPIAAQTNNTMIATCTR